MENNNIKVAQNRGTEQKKYDYRKVGNKEIICYLVLVLALLLVMLLGLVFGSSNIPLSQVVKALFGGEVDKKISVILFSVRMPRVVGAMLAGAGLAASGVILQAVLNNSLASPNTIGVNSGAGFLVMLSMIIFPQNLFLKSTMAFLGALITSVVILALAYVAEKSRITIVLAGITVSSFLSAGMNMMKIVYPDISVNATQFLVGSLSGVSFKELKYPLIGISCGIIILIVIANALNILSFGDGVASSLGLNVNFYRVLFLIIASVLAGLVVSFAGLIGFVGLIVPHICRFFFGHDARRLLPASVLLGATLVTFADLLGRVVFAPFEIPVGIILSIAGGPFFLYLLMKKGGRRVNA